MNTSAVKSSFYEDLKRVGSKVDEWPEWKRHSLRSSVSHTEKGEGHTQTKRLSIKAGS
jgi:hypothetical protein